MAITAKIQNSISSRKNIFKLSYCILLARSSKNWVQINGKADKNSRNTAIPNQPDATKRVLGASDQCILDTLLIKHHSIPEKKWEWARKDCQWESENTGNITKERRVLLVIKCMVMHEIFFCLDVFFWFMRNCFTKIRMSFIVYRKIYFPIKKNYLSFLSIKKHITDHILKMALLFSIHRIWFRFSIRQIWFSVWPCEVHKNYIK